MKVVYHRMYAEVYSSDPAAQQGRMLTTEDYLTIGEMIKGVAERACGGRRYAVLASGYNLAVLGKNVRALLEGMT